jgi:hypothetical protein
MRPRPSHCDLPYLSYGQITYGTPTRSGLTVDKDTLALIELSLDKCYQRDKMLEYVSILHVVQGNLAAEEGLAPPRLEY